MSTGIKAHRCQVFRDWCLEWLLCALLCVLLPGATADEALRMLEPSPVAPDIDPAQLEMPSTAITAAWVLLTVASCLALIVSPNTVVAPSVATAAPRPGVPQAARPEHGGDPSGGDPSEGAVALTSAI